jgi:antitoxin component of MazEF toxin-antitoxin module
MPSVKLGGKREVRLPKETIRALRLRKGMKFDIRVAGDVVVLVPARRIPKDQRYFWTEEWQRKEREADEDIARGDVLGPFYDADEAIRALRAAEV